MSNVTLRVHEERRKCPRENMQATLLHHPSSESSATVYVQSERAPYMIRVCANEQQPVESTESSLSSVSTNSRRKHLHCRIISLFALLSVCGAFLLIENRRDESRLALPSAAVHFTKPPNRIFSFSSNDGTPTQLDPASSKQLSSSFPKFSATAYHSSDSLSMNSMEKTKPPLRTAVSIADSCTPLPAHSPQRRLEFLHIPKTGGSALEIMAAQHNISWGACHWMKQINNNSPCPPHPERPVHHAIYKMSYWHLPMHLIDDGTYDPYQNADIFAIVRHPYARVVSEWNYDNVNVKRLGYDRSNPDHMNEFLQRNLARARHATDNMTDYFQWDGHYIPQYDYVNGQNVTVLRQDTLSDDFWCLMQI